MSSFQWPPPPTQPAIYANLAAFPSASSFVAGTLAVAADTGNIYESTGSVWQQVGGPGAALSITNFGSAPNSAGLTLTGGVLNMQPADGSNPGGISTTIQTFAGNKTFTGTISAANLSGTNSGDVTIGTANGLSLTGQALSLGTSSGATTGALTSADWTTFNNKQATITVGALDAQAANANGLALVSNVLSAQSADATHPGMINTSAQTIAGVKTFSSAPNLSSLTASLPLQLDGSKNITAAAVDLSGSQVTGTLAAGRFPALTGDVTNSAGNLSTTVSKIQGTTVSGTTGSGNVVFATAPTMTNPVVGTQSAADNSTKAASTAYVTSAISTAISGVNPAVAVQAATTAAGDTSALTYNNGVSGIGATLTGANNTALTVDGYTFTALNQRLLVKNDTQSPSGAFNGIYYVTQVQALALPLILTRALDYDTPSDMNNTGAIPVVNGTVNGTTSWVLTSQITTVGTDPLTFTKFTRNPADYLLVANNLSDVASKSTSFNNLSPMTTSGDIIYGGASGTGTRLGANSTGTNKYLQSVSSGTPAWAQVAFSDLSGSVAAGQMPALTGDITTSAGSVATTLATVNSNVGTFGSTSSIPTFTVNGKGLITAASGNASTATPTASIFAGWDSNKNFSAVNFLAGYSTTATAAGTTTLTVGSNEQQYFTGSTTQTVALPVVSTLVLGQQYQITNLSTGVVTVQSSGGNTLQAMAANTVLVATVISTSGTGTASWSWNYYSTGTVPVSIGGTGQTTLTNHGVLVGAGTSAITQLAVPASGTVLTGVASSDPAFSATPTLGVNGTTTGQLNLATSTASGQSVTIQNRSTTSAWNFNLPTTAGSANQVLTSQGGGSNNMTWTTVSGASVAPTVQTFTSTGTQTGWLFSVTSWTGTIVSGDTYTNNGHTYTAQQVTQTNGASGFTLFMSGTSATTSTGTDTLTRSSSASGPATITFDGTKNIATATYTTPASVLYLEIKLVGGGGSGAGGNATTSAGNNGTSTYFGPNILNGLFGTGGSSGTGGTGGTASVGAALGQAVTGGNGQGSFVRSGTALGSDGGMGASTPFAGGGAGGSNSGNGAAGPTNSGAGGGGGGGVANSAYAGAGGGAGGYVNAIITSPAATYPYVVGSGGAGVSTTTNGGAGAAGYIIVVEKYQ